MDQTGVQPFGHLTDADYPFPHTITFSPQLNARHAEESERQDPFSMWYADQENSGNEGDAPIGNLGMSPITDLRFDLSRCSILLLLFLRLFAALLLCPTSLFCGAYHV